MTSAEQTRRPRARATFALAALFALCAAAAVRAQQDAPAKDGPARIVYGHLFKEGATTFEEIKPEEVAPLPTNYAVHNDVAYRLKTEAVVSGPHVLDFRLPSVRERRHFDELRVLCAEWDWIDQKAFWADCTIDEGQHARDFATRTLRARVERQAVYVVVRLVEPFKPLTARAELSVEIVAPKERAYANRDLVYEIRVTNRGPDDAEALVMHGAGFASNEFVSMTAPERGRGRCRQNGSNFGCRLDLLEKNTTAVFLLTARPYESPRMREAAAPQPFHVLAYIAAAVVDTNSEDDKADSTIVVQPDPNRAPEVKFVAPADDAIFRSPARLKLTAEASDEDGRVARVAFYDGEKLLGEGAAVGGKTFALDWPDAAPGLHWLSVVVTDDGGRADYDTRRVVVNGPLTVRLTGPRPDSVFKTRVNVKAGGGFENEPLSLTVTASVGPAGAKVKALAFVLNGERAEGAPAGADASTGEALYTHTFRGHAPASYTLAAVATDEHDVASVSEPVRFRYSYAPPVRVKAVGGPVYEEGAAVELRAELLFYPSREDPSVKGSRVDFYAGGKLIGSGGPGIFSGDIQPFHWEDAPPGEHLVTAVLTNGDGVASEPSAPLRITVRKK